MQGEQAYRGEHTLAWLMAALAIGLGIIGALEAFGIIDVGDTILAAGMPVVDDDASSFRDGLMFLIPGLITAFLAFTLHRAEHHVPGMDRPMADRPGMMTGEPRSRDESHNVMSEEKALWNGEHAASYLAVLASLTFGVIGLLVGFNVLSDDHTFYDGTTWMTLGLLTSFLAGALHSVSHHQPAYGWDEVRTRLEGRTTDEPFDMPNRPEPGRERR
jgi:hypothetical protein